jgi:outer membrane biosynthesis protein TonB
VEFFVEKDGSVREVTPVGAPHALLAQISKEAVLQWKFEPPTSKGRPVRFEASQEFRFRFDG